MRARVGHGLKLVVAGAVVAAGAAVVDVAAAGEPYPGSVPTTCVSVAMNQPVEGRAARVRFEVTVDGEGAPAGRVHFIYQRKKTNAVVEEYRRSYTGPGSTKYAFRRLPAGRFRVAVRFDSKPNDSVYQDCSNSVSQRVRARKG